MKKTVTAISADGTLKQRVPIEERAGAFCIARAGLFGSKRCWAVYHTRSGCVMGNGFSLKKDARVMLRAAAKLKGNWDRPVEEIRKDRELTQAWATAYSDVMCKLGFWLKVS